MARKKSARKRVRQSATVAKRRRTSRGRPKALDPLLAAVKGAERRNVGHVRLEVGRAGAARVKRMGFDVGA